MRCSIMKIRKIRSFTARSVCVYFFSSSNNVIKDHKHFWHISGSLNYGCSEILSENEIAPLGFPDNYNPKLGRKKRISTKNGIFVPEKKSRNFKINL